MRSLLWLALSLHIALATAYAWTTPAFEGPDENSHYEYAWHLANAGKLPLTGPLAKERALPQTEGAVLAHHPPLYYGVVAAAMQAAGRDDTVFGPRINPRFGDPAAPSRHLRFLHERHDDPLLGWLRMTSVLLGAITIALVHRLARRCCPHSPRTADLAALLVATLPMWSSLHGLLNSDVLAATSSTAVLLALVRQLQNERITVAGGAGVGALLGLALLTKLTTLFLVGLAGLTFLVLVLRGRRRRTPVGFAPLAAGAVAMLAVSGWVFVRNYLLYGDPLAMSAHDSAFQPIPENLRWHYIFGWQPWPASVPSFFPTVFTSLLGRFGWFSLPPNPVLVWTGAAVTALAVLGLLLACFERHRPHLPRATWLLLLAGALVLLGTLYFNLSAPQPQARLLFPAVGPAAVLLAAGLVRLSRGLPFRRWLIALLPITAVLVLVFEFAPAFDPALAEAPVDQRTLVGHIVEPDGPEQIRWQTAAPEQPLDAPLSLTFVDDGAPADARYSLYVYDERGRVWLATHEWSHGAVQITGGSVTLSPDVWNFVPSDVSLSCRVRRVPSDPEQRPGTLPTSPAWPFVRR